MSMSRWVTVVAPRGRLDVALPTGAPVAELVPELVELTRSGPLDPAGGWGLHRLGGRPFPALATIEQLNLRDGDLLQLNPLPLVPPPAVFDDTVDAIASAAQERTGQWNPAVARRTGAAAAVLLGAALAVGTAAGTSVAGLRWSLVALISGVLAAALLAAATVLARGRHRDQLVAAAVAAAGLPHVALAGLAAVTALAGGEPLGPVVAALAVTAGYAIVAAVLVTEHTGWFVAAAVAAVAGLLAAGLVATGVTVTASAGILAVTVTALSPMAAMISARLGRLPLPWLPRDIAAFRRDEPPTAGPDVIRITHTAQDSLTALITALAMVAASAWVILLLAPDPWAWALVGAGAIVLALRSRAHSRVAQRLVLLTMGSAAILAAAARLAVHSGPGVVLTVGILAAGTALACAGYALRARGSTASPYWGRFLDIGETVATLSLGPLVAVQAGVFSALRAWGG